MKRIFLLVTLAAATACNKPSPEDCRKALTNMQHLLGTDNLLKTGDFETEVRACRGGSSKESVECATKANSLEDLRACNFMKVPAKADGDKPADKAPEPKAPDKPADSK